MDSTLRDCRCSLGINRFIYGVLFWQSFLLLPAVSQFLVKGGASPTGRLGTILAGRAGLRAMGKGMDKSEGEEAVVILPWVVDSYAPEPLCKVLGNG
jgi:hypothetical protein